MTEPRYMTQSRPVEEPRYMAQSRPVGQRPTTAQRALDVASAAFPAVGIGRALVQPNRDTLGIITTANKEVPFFSEAADAAQAVVNRATGRARTLGEGWQQARGTSRETQREFAERRPYAAALTRGTALAASVAVPGGALAQGGRAANAALGGASAALQAGVYAGGTGEGTAMQRITRANEAMANPVNWALGAGVGALGVPAREVARRPVSPAVRTLAQEGVQMTPGQMRGGLVNRTEELAMRVPFVGQPIREARRRSIETFNRAAVNRSLDPIGQQLPENVATGQDAVGFAQQAIGQEYDRLLPSVTIQPDAQLMQDIAGIQDVIAFMTPDRAGQIEQLLNQRVTSRLGDRQAITGQEYQQIRSELGRFIRQYAGSSDADQRAAGEALQTVQSALDAAASRQNPAFGQALGNANAAYANLVQLERAAAANPTTGMFTPRQQGIAIRQSDRSVRKRATAAGRAMNQDLATAAQEVLPNTVPDSGTPEGAAGATLGAGLFIEPVAALSGMATLGAGYMGTRTLYSPQAMQAANRALNAQIGRQAQMEALQELGLLARQNPELRALYSQVAQRMAQGVGAQAGAGASMQSLPQTP
jgi:hypothetical protein